MPAIDLSILNQRQTPAFYASSLATRPAFGFAGRIFIDTDSPSTGLYRDTGAAWVQIADPGAGTTGTLQQVTTNGKTTNQGITITSGGLITNNIVLNQNSGTVKTTAISQTMANNDIWEIYGIGNNGTLLGEGELVFSLGDDGSPYASGGERFRFTYDSGIVSGTPKDVFIVDYDLSYFNTSLGINTPTPGAALDVHSGVNVIAQLNQTVSTNNSLLAFQNAGSGLWRIGNFYNAGANDFGVFDVIGGIEPLRIKKTTGQVLIGTNTVGSGKLVVASATGDNGVQIVGSSAPSLRIDNAESGPTKRAGFGISTATNNFIQGSADRDFCMFNGSTTASPILFGIYDTTNVQEAARISAARNLLVGGTIDSGEKLQISGTSRFNNNVTIGSTLNPWGANPFFVQQIGIGGFIAGRKDTGNQLQIGQNAYFDGSNWIYNATGSASRYILAGNEYRWLNAPSGTAGNIITFTQQMTLSGSTGNLLIGTTTDNGSKLQVNGIINQRSDGNIDTATNNTIGTSFVSLIGTNSRSLFFASWFNTTGGAQGSAVFQATATLGITMISNADGSGAGVSFQYLGGVIQAKTTVGQVAMVITSIGTA